MFYLSFKLGDYEGLRNGRWFTDLTEASFRALVDVIDDIAIEKMDIRADVRPRRSSEKWLNAWCVKV